MRLVNIIFFSLTFFSLMGCSVFNKKDPVPVTPEVKVVTREVPIQIMQPQLPREIQLLDVEWFVLTRDNMDGKLLEVEKYQGGDFVVFALTPQGYENMARNLQEIRRYFLQQKEIILYYRKATEITPEKSQKPVDNTN